MPLWVFIFTEPTCQLESARIAAASRAQAWVFAKAILGGHAPNGTIVTFGGEVDRAEPDLVSFERRA